MHALRPAALAAIPLLALVGLASCASEGGPRRYSSRCGEPGDSVLVVAVGQYLKSISPTPRRFVIPIGGGSDSLPEAARAALRSAGPTFLYPADSAKRQTVETHLLSRGDWPTLLVALRDIRQESDSSVLVRLGGRFVSGELDEQPAPTRSVRLACRESRWVFDRTEDEQSS
jgi:hypothetical protein